jgi:hypothetical protein
VLKKDPRRFAMPPTVHTFGADYAETYTLLAALAARIPGGERLALTHAGAAAHHIEDVANQIHTVQVGNFDFFFDAKIQSIAQDLLSVGGLLRSRPGFKDIGIGILSNHHTLAEALYMKHLLAPGDPVAKLSAEAPTDPQFAATLHGIDAACAPGFTHAIVMALAERSSYEGPDVYRTIRAAADKRMSKVGETFDEESDPDLALRPGADLSEFFTIEARGARRSDQALQAWWQRFNACTKLDTAGEARLADALVRSRLDAQDAAEARARAWTPEPPAKERINAYIPLGYAFVLIGIGLIVWRRRRRRA